MHKHQINSRKKGSVILRNKEHSKEKCHFTVHPCNFEVEIKEVRPFHTFVCKPIILDLKVISHCNAKSCIKIKSRPKYGNLYLLRSSTLIYKSNNGFCGLDLFQILIEDEYDGRHIENIFIRVIK
jgi:hypothetical protein